MIVSKVISTITDKVRTIKALCFGKTDVRTPAECAPYGYDANPIEGVKCIYSQTTTNGQDVIIGYVNVNQKSRPGESRMYSTKVSGEVNFNMWLRSGEALIGRSEDPDDYINHLTQFEALKTGIDLYLTSLNTQITAGVASAGGVYTPPASPLDISAAKTTHIKVE